MLWEIPWEDLEEGELEVRMLKGVWHKGAFEQFGRQNNVILCFYDVLG